MATRNTLNPTSRDRSVRRLRPLTVGAAIADATHRLATGRPQPDDLARLERWSGEIAGRGACRHPDGAVGFLRSGLARGPN